MTDTLIVRYMNTGDIPQVMAIDAVCFNPPWPEQSYRFELNQSQVAHMLVLETFEEQTIPRWRQWLNRLLGRQIKSEKKSIIVGYGGLWQVVEEAHISTIASHPDYRGRKFGELLLVSMVKRSIMLKAEYIVLEVRVSNSVAQSLYKKYGFEIHGTKKNYYQRDQEDAYDMRLMLTDDAIAQVETLYQILCKQVHFDNRYSNTLHPRLKK
ncbi:MAG: ribosomal protein S18-alanine N-acetyltransferase [Phototrophicaceae bacterium]